MNVLKATEDTLQLMEMRIREGGRGHTMQATGDSGTIHLHSMLDKMKEIATQPHSDMKLNRWLGYIQGCVVAHGLATVEDMKELNAGYFSGLTE